jgi:hypothetical protein
MKIIAKIVVGAATLAALSTVASAQFRTVGPATPFLVTGRSVSVPATHHEDRQQVLDEAGKDAVLPDDGQYIAGPERDRTMSR